MSHPVTSAAGPGGMPAWPLDPVLVVPLVTAAAIYACGWTTLRRRMPERFHGGVLAAFVAGLAAVAVALGSPLGALGHRSLPAHMIQHLLLMLVAPPLLWLGAPVAPLLAGLPRAGRRAVAWGLATRPARRITATLGDPRVAWGLFAVAFWAWHVPALYEAALRDDAWHHVEHASFLLAGLAFWRPVISPWPTRRPWPAWAMIVYLVLAEAQATLLSAILTFSDRVLYASYAPGPSPGNAAALEDQAMAGVIMWIPGSAVFALALLRLVFQGLASQSRSASLVAAPATTSVTATNGSTATNAGQRS